MQICEDGLDSDGQSGSGNADPCIPDTLMQLNVSSETNYITLHPALRDPEIQNLRVEVAGQVLSQGGNVGADQLADTTAQSTTRWGLLRPLSGSLLACALSKG